MSLKIQKLWQLNTEQTIQLKNGLRTWTNPSPKKPYNQPSDLRKDVQLQQLLGKCKSELQCDATSTSSQLLEWPLSTRQVTISAGEIVEKKKTSFTAGGNVNWYRHCGKQHGKSSKLTKIRVTIWPSNPSAIYPKNSKTVIHKDLCTPLFIAALLTWPRHGDNQSVFNRGIDKEDVVRITWNTTQP